MTLDATLDVTLDATLDRSVDAGPDLALDPPRDERRPDARVALAAALKERLRTQPLARVTVTQLVRDRGLTRQAFYYHFHDVQDLAAWVFETEVAQLVHAEARHDSWADGLVRLLAYLRANRTSTEAVLDGLGRARLADFLFRQMRPVTDAVVREVGGGGPAQAADHALVVDFYTSAVVAVVLRWVVDGMVDDPYRLVGDVELILHSSVRESVERLDARARPRAR
ncbi:TetR/AcrR family transcriptional regulator [Cellulomonas sp. PSBB021]|uniref:TetR/AcrR family transcriptional regulator n=1 Tax=Cellulomonas sp. PSBB021 TaxID=2003551 RepID=UPI001E2D85D4|nr:TetR-like C-terminal domain-containing protein [Cellulomonas sp. PSBB021]